MLKKSGDELILQISAKELPFEDAVYYILVSEKQASKFMNFMFKRAAELASYYRDNEDEHIDKIQPIVHNEFSRTWNVEIRFLLESLVVFIDKLLGTDFKSTILKRFEVSLITLKDNDNFVNTMRFIIVSVLEFRLNIVEQSSYIKYVTRKSSMKIQPILYYFKVINHQDRDYEETKSLVQFIMLSSESVYEYDVDYDILEELNQLQFERKNSISKLTKYKYEQECEEKKIPQKRYSYRFKEYEKLLNID